MSPLVLLAFEIISVSVQGVDRVDSIYQYLCTLNMTIPKATTYQTVAGKVDIKIVTLGIYILDYLTTRM